MLFTVVFVIVVCRLVSWGVGGGVGLQFRVTERMPQSDTVRVIKQISTGGSFGWVGMLLGVRRTNNVLVITSEPV